MNAQEAQADNEVVNGTFFINNQPASVLFDSGADKSFVSLSFETMLRVSRTKLSKPLTVEVASCHTPKIPPAEYYRLEA